MARGPAVAGALNGYVFSAAVPGSRPKAHYTARVTAFHPDAEVPIEAGLILWQR